MRMKRDGEGKIQKAVRTALSNLEESAGGREPLTYTLSHAEDIDSSEHRVLQMLADPMFVNHGLANICEKAGLTLGRFLKLFQKGRAAQAYIETMNKVYEPLPGVAEDVMRRSVTHHVVCTDCNGFKFHIIEGRNGEPKSTKECVTCHGQGTLLRDPDLERQKLALEMGGLLKRGTGIQINNTQQQLNASVSGPMRSTVEFREAIGKLLYPGRERVVDVPAEEV